MNTVDYTRLPEMYAAWQCAGVVALITKLAEPHNAHVTTICGDALTGIDPIIDRIFMPHTRDHATAFLERLSILSDQFVKLDWSAQERFDDACLAIARELA